MYDRVVFATDLEPDDFEAIRLTCRRMRDPVRAEPRRLELVLGEGNPSVKEFLAEEAVRALKKTFPWVDFHVTGTWIQSPVEYGLAELDAEFNTDPEDAEFNTDPDAFVGEVVGDSTKLGRSILMWRVLFATVDPTLIIWTRPIREIFSLEVPSTLKAPLFIYGGYNLRCVGATLENFETLTKKFAGGGVYQVERLDYLGPDFDSMAEIFLKRASEEPTAFSRFMERVCRIWNAKTLEFKLKSLNPRPEFAAAVREKRWDAAYALARVLFGGRALMDALTIINCARYPDSQMLFADVLAPVLTEYAETEFKPHRMVDAGSFAKNPVFELDEENGTWMVPLPHDKVNLENRIQKLRWAYQRLSRA